MRPTQSRLKRNISRVFLAIPLVAMLAACNTGLNQATVSQVTPAQASETEYRLGGGDKIAINIFGEGNITGTYQVDAGGAISLPLIGRFDVGDRTPAQVERELAAKLKEGIVKDPLVSVSVVEYRPFYVVGEVARPGAYSFFNGFTILNALALAGGQTYRADLAKISIVRHSRSGETKTQTGTMAGIQPGDVIIVPERNF